MTIVVYDENTLFADSKKVIKQNEYAGFGQITNKIKIIGDGAIAYALYGDDVLDQFVDTLEATIKAAMFIAWASQQLASVDDIPVDTKVAIADRWSYWNKNYCELYYKTPPVNFNCIAISRNMAVRLSNTDATISAPAPTQIQDSVWCDATFGGAYDIYKSMGMRPIQAINTIVADSPVCKGPINSVRQCDLEPTNYKQFIRFLLEETLKKCP